MALTLDYTKENGATLAGAYVKIATINLAATTLVDDSYTATSRATCALAVYGSTAARDAQNPDCWACLALDADTATGWGSDRDSVLSAAYAYLKTLDAFAGASDC